MSEAQQEVKSAVETVKMSDGRQVEFVGKRKLLKETLIDNEKIDIQDGAVVLYPGAVKIRLDYRNGETRTYVPAASLIARHVGHGGEQKLGDETAGVQDVDDMVIYVDELIDRLNKGEWTTKREGSPFAGASVLMKALIEATGKSPEQVKAFLSSKTPAEKAALRTSQKLKPIIERIEAEKASKSAKIDTDALLSELN